jgi:propionyl-CoA synthetase
LGNIASSCRCRPACLPTLWNAETASVDAYLAEFPGYYKTADAGFIDEDGYLFIMARTDDIINVAGHRLSTGGMEEGARRHPDVVECAVIGIADSMKGQIPIGFIVINSGVNGRRGGRKGVVKLVRDKIGPVAAFKPRDGGQAAAEDPFGQDPAGDHAENCRRGGMENAGDDR